eukprot:CAMPEP_0194510962 /NCGR_PEP_ID=MMETSP0253-20130528/42476_1 /TAXON_ID=2966 /ORGANISM="Noctiluca scintillans" /LENGTH=193 /DNA_ID=CAMNT_0039354253 /DNA_START=20 /DNA_END=598 /DNA_ORIENTATION=-
MARARAAGKRQQRSNDTGDSKTHGGRKNRKFSMGSVAPKKSRVEFEDVDFENEGDLDDSHMDVESVESDASSIVEEDAIAGDDCRGSSSADVVYRELLRRGAVPAVVGKRKHVQSGSDEVEMELYTPDAARKARLIPERRRRHLDAVNSGSAFESSSMVSDIGKKQRPKRRGVLHPLLSQRELQGVRFIVQTL